VSALTRTAVCLFLIVGLIPDLASGQSRDRHSIVPVVYSTDLVSRNAELTFAASVLATDGTDQALQAIWLKRREPGDATARAVRIAKLALFDAPVVAFFVGLNHEGGHISRAREKNFPYSFRLVGGPWSSQRFELFALDFGIFDDLGAQAGGFEASRVLKDRSEARYWTKDRISPGHALVSIVSALDLPLYALWNLAPGQFDDGFPLGDPAAVLSILQTKKLLAGEPYNLDPARSRMRSRSLLNLLDTSLWSLVYGIVGDHAWKGEDGVRVRWLRVGGVELLPSVRYELTAMAPEYHLRSQFRTVRAAGAGYVRWSERVDDARQVGIGGSLSPRAAGRIMPRLDLDVWSHSRDGAGLHGAMTMEIVAPNLRRAVVTVTLGGKSTGHAAALPFDNGAYVSAGLVFTPW
jgi:hypothetical protein